MVVRFKKLSEKAQKPNFSLTGDAGADLTCTEYILHGIDLVTYYTDLAVEIPQNYVGLLFPRSSIRNMGLQMCNSVGVIDSNFRDGIEVSFRTTGTGSIYKVGDRIAQLIIIPYPVINYQQAEELSESNRTGGFGTSNK